MAESRSAICQDHLLPKPTYFSYATLPIPGRRGRRSTNCPEYFLKASTIPIAFTHNQLYHHHNHEREFIFILILYTRKLPTPPPPHQKKENSKLSHRPKKKKNNKKLAFNILVAFNNFTTKISLIPKNLDPSHIVLWSLEMFAWRLNIFLLGFIPIKMKMILGEKT